MSGSIGIIHCTSVNKFTDYILQISHFQRFKQDIIELIDLILFEWLEVTRK